MRLALAHCMLSEGLPVDARHLNALRALLKPVVACSAQGGLSHDETRQLFGVLGMTMKVTGSMLKQQGLTTVCQVRAQHTVLWPALAKYIAVKAVASRVCATVGVVALPGKLCTCYATWFPWWCTVVLQ